VALPITEISMLAGPPSRRTSPRERGESWFNPKLFLFGFAAAALGQRTFPKEPEVAVTKADARAETVDLKALQGAAANAALALVSMVVVGTSDVRGAMAENEAAMLAQQKSTAEIVSPQCFKDKCQLQMEACMEDGDCSKGLLCTAKCNGDTQCLIGCFARYTNTTLEKVLQCTIEDAGCISIATQTPGPDSPMDAPKPPKPLVAATPDSMAGKWYKVMGFNTNYDCYECQRNTFAKGKTAEKMLGTETLKVGPNSVAVEVEYAMPRERVGLPPETINSRLVEKLEFDPPGSVRTAHTQGRMFGLTFWENWYVIGRNDPNQQPFRFVYYTGKTLQNRYDGAFVYARTPELPAASMSTIYKIAREAGLEPTKACCVDNSCFAKEAAEEIRAPLFTPVASAEVYRPPEQTSQKPPPTGLTAQVDAISREFSEIFEDPNALAKSVFDRQRPMSSLREFDRDGNRVPFNSR
jgi:hypothetical protein